MNRRYRIKHVTGFTYAGTAHASYNEARMTPLTVPGQTTLFSQIESQPAAISWRYRDYWGTQVTVFDLQRPHQQLRVTATSLVETDERTPPGEPLDWTELRSPDTVDRYAELLATTPLTELDPELVDRAAEVAAAAPPSGAAAALAEVVRSTVAYMPGATGVRTSAREAWQLREGVCQDIAHLTVGLLRAAGDLSRRS
jgi:transglutaminase-like putative cysteine protease